jgi:hypothetical protein
MTSHPEDISPIFNSPQSRVSLRTEGQPTAEHATSDRNLQPAVHLLQVVDLELGGIKRFCGFRCVTLRGPIE